MQGSQKHKKEDALSNLGSKFCCARCSSMTARTVAEEEKLCDGVETVKGFCYLGDRLRASGNSEAAVTAGTRRKWVKFRKCTEMFYGKRFLLRLKRKGYQSCMQSAMLYGRENRESKLKRRCFLESKKRAMLRAMCRVKLMDKKKLK